MLVRTKLLQSWLLHHLVGSQITVYIIIMVQCSEQIPIIDHGQLRIHMIRNVAPFSHLHTLRIIIHLNVFLVFRHHFFLTYLV